MKVQEFLRAGDVLLYDSGGIVGWAIKVKTWHQIVHCEGYVGGGRSVASRGPQDGHGGGVGIADLRLDGLVRIMRPRAPFDLAAAMRWFETVDGQGYDYLGLFRFYGLGWSSKAAQICSAFLTRWLRRGGIEPFSASEDAHNIAPFQFAITPALEGFTVTTAGEVVPTPAYSEVDE